MALNRDSNSSGRGVPSSGVRSSLGKHRKRVVEEREKEKVSR